MEVKDKVVVVTGAASGIGAAMASRFVAEGARTVVFADISSGVQPVARRNGGVPVVLDVRSAEAIRELVDGVVLAHGEIDLFCANAGVLSVGGLDLPESEWARSWEINVMAHVRAAQALLPHWLERGAGYFLQTISSAGLLAAPGALPYSVTKQAALAFGEWMAIQHGTEGIRVSCLCPKGVRTPMLAVPNAVTKPWLDDAITAGDVADAVVDGLRSERFLILPHRDVLEYSRRRADDRDRWIAGMQRLVP